MFFLSMTKLLKRYFSCISFRVALFKSINFHLHLSFTALWIILKWCTIREMLLFIILHLIIAPHAGILIRIVLLASYVSLSLSLPLSLRDCIPLILYILNSYELWIIAMYSWVVANCNSSCNESSDSIVTSSIHNASEIWILGFQKIFKKPA